MRVLVRLAIWALWCSVASAWLGLMGIGLYMGIVGPLPVADLEVLVVTMLSFGTIGVGVAILATLNARDAGIFDKKGR